jgi:hypothetical protein
VITIPGFMVRPRKKISCLYRASAWVVFFAAFGLISSAVEAGVSSANVAVSPSVKYVGLANAEASNTYGRMVVAGIIAVLTAVTGAAIWRSHELAC